MAIVGLLVVGICFLELWFLLGRSDPANPLVNGRHLSTELLLAFGPGRSKTSTNSARNAVIASGTNSLPLLKRWLTTEPTDWRVFIGSRAWRLGIVSVQFPPDDLRLVAVNAINDLKTNAAPLMFELAAACTNSSARFADVAADALFNAVWDQSPLVLKDAVTPSIDRALAVLANRVKSDPALARRINTLEHARRGPLLRPWLVTAPLSHQASVLRLLSDRKEAAWEALPHLLAHLESTNASIAENAALCLRNYGAQAKSALPALEKAESYPDERVRAEAAKAKGMINAQIEDPLLRR